MVISTHTKRLRASGRRRTGFPCQTRPHFGATFHLQLALAVATEGADGPLRQPHDTVGSVLGLGEDEPAGLLAVPAHALWFAAHLELAGVEVYVGPLEPERLALSEPCHLKATRRMVAEKRAGVEAPAQQSTPPRPSSGAHACTHLPPGHIRSCLWRLPLRAPLAPTGGSALSRTHLASLHRQTRLPPPSLASLHIR